MSKYEDLTDEQKAAVDEVSDRKTFDALENAFSIWRGGLSEQDVDDVLRIWFAQKVFEAIGGEGNLLDYTEQNA